MTRAQIAIALIGSLAVFFFLAGPVWRHPWQIDASVYWSYAVIPVLVAGVLLVARTWRWRTFFLGTLEVTLLKFGITYGIAIVLWMTAGTPPEPPQPAVAVEHAPPRPAPSLIPPSTTGEIAGHSAPGALVWIDSGLERFTFAAPSGSMEILNDGRGFAPPVVAVQVGQPLRARVTDGRTHTLHARDDKTGALRNLAVPSGATRTVEFSRPLGLVEVNCLVHPRETPSWMLVTDHPFFGYADSAGNFLLRGVPAGTVRLAAFDPVRGRAAVSATVHEQARAEVTLEFGSPFQ